MNTEEQFTEAVAASKLLPSKPDNQTLLKLYSLYKQATEGDNTTNAPSNAFDFVATAKYNAWNELKGTGKEEAMNNYIHLINQLKGS